MNVFRQWLLQSLYAFKHEMLCCDSGGDDGINDLTSSVDNCWGGTQESTT